MLANDASIDPLALHIHRKNVERGRMRSRRISTANATVTILPEIEGRIGGIWGARDSTGGGVKAIEERRTLFRAQQPDCLFDIIDGAGHWVMYETPQTFDDTLLRHLYTYDRNSQS